MDDQIDLVPALPGLATVRAYGRVYVNRERATRQAHTQLVLALRDAHRGGATVSELAAASGLSRPAVYRAVAGLQRQ